MLIDHCINYYPVTIVHIKFIGLLPIGHNIGSKAMKCKNTFTSLSGHPVQYTISTQNCTISRRQSHFSQILMVTLVYIIYIHL